jgi:hypothetical protein
MPNEINITHIQEAYANMYDEEILDFAKNEGLKVSADAFLVLREELNRREIGADIIEQLEHEIILQASLRSKRFTEDINKSLFNEAFEFCLSQKQAGAGNYDIYAGLIEMGVEEEYANYMVNKIQEWTENLQKNSKTDLQVGVVILILGTMALYVAATNGRFEFVMILISIAGLVRIITSVNKNSRYKKILDTIREEEAPGNY